MTAPASTTDAGTDDQGGATPPADLGDAGKAALTAERAARRQAEQAARQAAAELQALRDKDASASEVATRKATEAEQRAVSAERQLAQIQAAIAAKLDLSLAPRLQGTTPEELLADAKALAKQFAPQPPAPPVMPGKPVERLSGGGDPAGTALPLNGDPLVDALNKKLGIS